MPSRGRGEIEVSRNMPINTTNTWLSTRLGSNPTLCYRHLSLNYTSSTRVSLVTPGEKARPEHLAQAKDGFAAFYPMICKHNHSDILKLLTFVR